jgi:hypothetical protein
LTRAEKQKRNCVEENARKGIFSLCILSVLFFICREKFSTCVEGCWDCEPRSVAKFALPASNTYDALISRTQILRSFGLLSANLGLLNFGRWFSRQLTSVADPGCLSRILDPTFFHPGSRIRIVSIPDPGSASKNLIILTPKNGF